MRDNLVSLGNRVVVVPIDNKEEHKVNGIIIPDSDKDSQFRFGAVVYAPEELREKFFKVTNDVLPHIYFSKYKGIEVKKNDHTYIILDFDDILAADWIEPTYNSAD